MSDREYRRHMETRQLTIAQVAARGDSVRLVCLDCPKRTIIPAADLVGRHGHKIVGQLTPVCQDCARSRRRGPGLHQPGRGTYLEILWPDDRP